MQPILKRIHNSRHWQTLASTARLSCTTVVVIIVLALGQPDIDVATGGCSAPDGICNTAIGS